MTDDRGQAFTLEGVMAGLLLLLVLLLSMQSIVVTPTTEGGVDRDLTAQLGTEANDVLAAAHEEGDRAGKRGDLTEAALAWDPDEEAWAWDEDEWGLRNCPTVGDDNSELGLCTKLNETFTSRYYRYNVYVDYPPDADHPSETETKELFWQGTPGDNSATVTHSVAIYDDDELYGDDADRTVADVEDRFYAENMPDDNLYTIVEIRVVVW